LVSATTTSNEPRRFIPVHHCFHYFSQLSSFISPIRIKNRFIFSPTFLDQYLPSRGQRCARCEPLVSFLTHHPLLYHSLIFAGRINHDANKIVYPPKNFFVAPRKRGLTQYCFGIIDPKNDTKIQQEAFEA
jgi:hypothetical protein